MNQPFKRIFIHGTDHLHCTSPDFVYRNAASTNVAETFARVRARRAAATKQAAIVTTLTRKQP
jgi:hypothetical protein